MYLYGNSEKYLTDKNLNIGVRNYVLDSAKSVSMTGTGKGNDTLSINSLSKPLNQFTSEELSHVILSFNWAVSDGASGSVEIQFNETPWDLDGQILKIDFSNAKSGRFCKKFNLATKKYYGGSINATGLAIKQDRFTGTFTADHIKLEIGDVPTQWCPAPEDLAMKSDYDKLLGVGNLLTDDEMNIANALKSTAAQGAISNINYSNGVSRFHYKGINSYEVINWPFKVSPNTNYRMEIVVNSTNELTALDNDRPYLPWGVSSQEDLADNVSGDIRNWHLPLPWSKEISESITFNSGNYSKLYLIANFGFATDGIDTDITLQIKLFESGSIQTQIDQLRSQIEQLKQK